MTDNLKVLSAAATGGEWHQSKSHRIHTLGGRSVGACWGYNARGDKIWNPNDAALICTAINALRAGELVEAGKLRELVGEWRSEAESMMQSRDPDSVMQGAAKSDAADALSALIGEGE